MLAPSFLQNLTPPKDSRGKKPDEISSSPKKNDEKDVVEINDVNKGAN